MFVIPRLLAKRYTLHASSAGFSLLEIMIVLGLLALAAVLVGPVFRSLQTKNNLDIAASSVTEALRRAQEQAMNGRADTAWGVNLTGNNLTVFSGNSYASRQSAFDEKLSLPGGIAASGLSEIVFSKFSGLPQTTGNINLSNDFGSKQLVINGAGTINY